MKTNAFFVMTYMKVLHLLSDFISFYSFLLDLSAPATLGNSHLRVFIVFFYFPSRLSQGHIGMKLTLGSLPKITNPLLNNHLPDFLPCCSIFLLSLGNGSFLTFPALYLVTFPVSLSHQKTSTPCSGVLVCSLVYLKHLDRCQERSKRFNTHCLNK